MPCVTERCKRPVKGWFGVKTPCLLLKGHGGDHLPSFPTCEQVPRVCAYLDELIARADRVIARAGVRARHDQSERR